MKYMLLIMLGIGVLFSVFMNKKGESTYVVLGESIQVTPTPTPTPYPFYELTIPSLREKNYESTLGDRTFAYKGSDFTAFTTSYTSDGLTIHGLLTVPDGQMPAGGWPAIVFVHGYIPPLRYNTTQQYAEYVNYLARNKFVVFKIDLRGHGDSEGEPGGAYYSSEYVSDTLHAVAALKNSDVVRPNSIGLWGHSMAGNIVMRAFAVQPEISAVVIWAGAVYSYVDMRQYGINDSSYQPSQNPRRNMRQEIASVHGEPDLSNNFWRDLAPISYINDLKGALQLHHAIDDTVVPIGYSRDLIKALADTGIVYQLIEHASGGHNISGNAFSAAMSATVLFYQAHL